MSVYVVAEYKVKQECRKDFLTSALVLQSKSQREFGCKVYKLVEKNGQDNTFAFLEMWSSVSALEVHKNTTHYIELVPILEKCSECVEVSVYM